MNQEEFANLVKRISNMDDLSNITHEELIGVIDILMRVSKSLTEEVDKLKSQMGINSVALEYALAVINELAPDRLLELASADLTESMKQRGRQN